MFTLNSSSHLLHNLSIIYKQLNCTKGCVTINYNGTRAELSGLRVETRRKINIYIRLKHLKSINQSIKSRFYSY